MFSNIACELGRATELANYAEFAENPSESKAFEHAKSLLTLMTSGTEHQKGKLFIIGVSLTNFTNVVGTYKVICQCFLRNKKSKFKGLNRALQMFVAKLIQHNVSIYLHGTNPQYFKQNGMFTFVYLFYSTIILATTKDIPIRVFGPETNMTTILGTALGVKPQNVKNIK